MTYYKTEANQLILSKLEINLTFALFKQRDQIKKVEAPVIEGCRPINISKNAGISFEYTYENIRLPIPFTGGLLVAKDFIWDLYIHMGFHPAWKYRNVHELLFDNGKSIKATDVSNRIKEIRDELIKEPLQPGSHRHPNEIMEWIKSIFSRDYKFT